MPSIGPSVCFVILLATVLLGGCADDAGTDALPPSQIRVAILPDRSEQRLRAKYAPLLDYLRATTQMEFVLSVPRDYADLLERFDAGEVDLAWFGGLTFTQAAARSGAVPLAFRDVDLQFTSCYLVAAGDPRNTIAEFRGEVFAFGPDLSTSGHLMPRYYLERDGLQPEKWFGSVLHSAGHVQTAAWVNEGEVAVGVASCLIVTALFESGDLDASKVRLLETTPPYSDYVWATAAAVDENTRIRLLDAFLALDASIPEHRAILRSQDANTYLPAGVSDFDVVRMAAVQAGVLDEADSE